MAKINRYEDLKVWQVGMTLVKAVYELTMAAEFARDFGLKDQIRRSAVSIPSNIAEGFERNGNREFVHFLYIAKGSAGELRTQLLIAFELAYISKEQYDKINIEVTTLGAMLFNLIDYLKNSGYQGNKYYPTKVSEPEMDYNDNWKTNPDFQIQNPTLEH